MAKIRKISLEFESCPGRRPVEERLALFHRDIILELTEELGLSKAEKGRLIALILQELRPLP